MARARVLKPKPVSPIVPIALALKEKGYDPIPLRHKTGPEDGWSEQSSDPQAIAKWNGKCVGVRMHGSENLFAVDLDVQNQTVMDQIIEKYTVQWPEFMRRCVIRHSGGVKAMLIGRLQTDRKRVYSGRYTDAETSNRVEFFTTNDRRYIAVWGKHSEGREYGYEGPALHEVKLSDLPEFYDDDLNQLLAIANEVMEAAGLVKVEDGGADLDEVAFDLTPDMVGEVLNVGPMSLKDAESEAQGKFIYLHGRLFDAGSEHYRIKAKVTPGRGLTLWDWGTGVTHYWAHLGPQMDVLVPLLKQLEAAEATRTTPAAGGATMFTPNVPLTQDDVAMELARRMADTMQYCHDTGRWYVWTGVYWQPERTKLAFQACRELGRRLSDGLGIRTMKEIRKVSFAGGVEKFAQADPLLATTAERWNQDIYLLGTPEGTLDLRTGKLREPDPADGITRLAACAPDPTMKTPKWDKFLLETFKGDKELVDFSQVWFGYCLTGDISEHALWFGFGEGGNGKGVLINTITGIMKDYAVTAAMDTFTAAKGDRHSTELAMLQGARLVTASETEKGRAWAEARIKQITGGDPITARFMRQDNFTFTPQFKLALIGNFKPNLRSVDDAVRRRFNLIPFLNKPPVVNKRLERELRAEWPGILHGLAQGCMAWMASGLTRPEAVKVATDSYFADQDIMQQWLDDACEVRHGAAIFEPTASLFVSWSDYATRAGEYVGNRKAFAMDLSRRGFEPVRVGPNKARSMRGIKLKSTMPKKPDLNIVPKDLDEKPAGEK